MTYVLFLIKNTSKFQFGFKSKTSCIHALFTIRECVIPYIHGRKTQVYGWQMMPIPSKIHNWFE